MKKNKLKSYILFNIILVFIIIIIATISIYLGNGSNFKEYFSSINILLPLIIQISFVFFISNAGFVYFKKLKKEKLKQLDDIPILICIWSQSPPGKLLYVNNEAKQIFGIFDENFENSYIYDYVSDEEIEKAKTNIKNLILTKKGEVPTNVEEYVFAINKKERYNFITYTRKFSSNSFITFAIDHTAVKHLNKNLEKTSNKLKERKEFLSLLIEGLPKPMMYLDKELNIKFVSNLFEKDFNLTVDDLKENPEKALMSKNFKKNVPIVFESMYQKKPKTANDIVLLNGKKRVVRFDIIPDSVKNPTGVFIFIDDITEELITKKRLEYSIELNKSLFEISEILININDETKIEESFEKVFKNITKTLKVDKTYIIKYKNNKLNICDEYNKGFLSIYKNKSINLDETQSKYYHDNFENLGTYECNESPHSILFKLNSCIDVYSKNHEDGIQTIFGIGTVYGSKKISITEKNYVQSVAHIINETEKRIDQYEKLKIQEETLNTLLEKTDLGIIISGLDNKVHHINEVAQQMFKISENQFFVIEKYIKPEYKDKIVKFLKDRDVYKRKEVDVKTIDDIYLKIYSSQIDYEDTKAYLTIVTDVTKYINIKGER